MLTLRHGDNFWISGPLWGKSSGHPFSRLSTIIWELSTTHIVWHMTNSVVIDLCHTIFSNCDRDHRRANIKSELQLTFRLYKTTFRPCYYPPSSLADYSRWRLKMEIFSALLALCAGYTPITGEFSSQRPVTRSFDVFFDLRLNKRMNRQLIPRWFETPSRPLLRHCNVVPPKLYFKQLNCGVGCESIRNITLHTLLS